MAEAYIAEFSKMRQDQSGNLIPCPEYPPIATQKVSFTASAQSNVFNAKTQYIRVVCDANAHYVIDASPTATANDPLLPSLNTEFMGVRSDQRIAFYDGVT